MVTKKELKEAKRRWEKAQTEMRKVNKNIWIISEAELQAKMDEYRDSLTAYVELATQATLEKTQ